MWVFLCFFWQISIPAHLCTETYLPLPEHASILAGGRRWNQPRHNKNWSPLVGPRPRPAPGCWRTLKIHESTCGHKNYDCQGPKRARISTGGSRVDRPLASTMLHNEKGTTRKNKQQNKNNTAHENSANKTKQKEKQSPSQNPLGKKNDHVHVSLVRYLPPSCLSGTTKRKEHRWFWCMSHHTKVIPGTLLDCWTRNCFKKNTDWHGLFCCTVTRTTSNMIQNATLLHMLSVVVGKNQSGEIHNNDSTCQLHGLSVALCSWRKYNLQESFSMSMFCTCSKHCFVGRWMNHLGQIWYNISAVSVRSLQRK